MGLHMDNEHATARHCLVTGGAGFIGSHLTEALLAQGCRVSVVDDESTGSIANLAAVLGHPRLRYTKGSVADPALVHRLLEDVDEVYHLAAAVGVQLIARDPIRTIETNILPTDAPVERAPAAARGWARRGGSSWPARARSTARIPSRSVGRRRRPGVRPHPPRRWSYGTSKAIDEFLALAYWRQHGLPVVVGRFFNVVGPRQTGAYGMVLPRLIDAALAGGPLVSTTTGSRSAASPTWPTWSGRSWT